MSFCCCDQDYIKDFDTRRADAKKKSDAIAPRKDEKFKEPAAEFEDQQKRVNKTTDIRSRPPKKAREEMLTVQSFEDELKQVKKETYEAACALSRPPKKARLNDDGDGNGQGGADNSDNGKPATTKVVPNQTE